MIEETSAERNLRKRREWYARNKEKEAARRDLYKDKWAEWQKGYRLRHPERVKEGKRKFYTSEKGKVCKQREEAAYAASGGRKAAEERRSKRPLSEARRECRKAWAKRNRWYGAATRAFRRLIGRMPLSDGEKVEINGYYLFVTCFPWFNVDHIIPVKGKTMSGLHNLKNLQVIDAELNRRKSNKVCPAYVEIMEGIL